MRLPALRFVILAGIWVACTARLVAAADDAFVVGADLSLLKYIEDHGVSYRDNGQGKDGLAIFRDHGFNWVRLRLFVNPDGKEGQVNTMPYTLAMATQAKAAGFHFLLDLHYSDGWADPGHQIVPRAWAQLSHVQLVDQVFAYTRDTVAAFRDEDCAPDMVEVGNEITLGMMWPDGKIGSDGKWDAFGDLLKAGIRGVHAGEGSVPIKIMLHIDRGGDKGVSRWFFEHLATQAVPFDVIGLSYYPFWNGKLDKLKENMAYLAGRFHKDIIVAETGYNWRDADPKKLEYPPTPEGQSAFLSALAKAVASVPDGHGKGVFYWAPEWIDGTKWGGPPWTHSWENRALFDDQGNALPALDAFRAAGASSH